MYTVKRIALAVLTLTAAIGSQASPLCPSPVTQQPAPIPDPDPAPPTPPRPPKPTPTQYFGVSRNIFNSLASGAEGTLNIHTNASWDITQYPADWIKLDRHGNVIYITFAENTDVEPRTTSMVLRGATGDETIKFHQNGHVEFKVKSIELANSDSRGEKLFSDFGEQFYYPKTRCVLARLTYDGPEEPMRKKVLIRLTRPGDFVDTNSQSPEGYSADWYIDVVPGTDNQINLLAWGSDDDLDRRYFPGTYRYEVWVDGEYAGYKDFTILNAPGRPHVDVRDVWLEEDAVNSNGEPGYKIHLKCNVSNFKGGILSTAAFTFADSDNELKLYNNIGNRLYTAENTDIIEDEVSIPDKEIFVPLSLFANGAVDQYGDSHPAGSTIYLRLQITNANSNQPFSDYYYFPVTLK